MTTGILTNTRGRLVPLQNTLKRTKQIDISSAISGTNWSTTRAVVVFYADSNGVWRMVGNIDGQLSSQATAIDLTITAIAAKASTDQAVDAHLWHNTNGHFATARATMTNLSTTNTNLYAATPSADNLTRAEFSFDIELNAEPTWASLGTTWAAVAEVSGDVTAYIPPCAALVSGIINNEASNTSGNLIKGRTDGAAIPAGYVGETLSITGYANIANTRTAVRSVSLSAGKWLITGAFGSSNTVASNYVDLYLSTTQHSGTTIYLGYGTNANSFGINQILFSVATFLDVGTAATYYFNAYRAGTFSENVGNSGVIYAIRIA